SGSNFATGRAAAPRKVAAEPAEPPKWLIGATWRTTSPGCIGGSAAQNARTMATQPRCVTIAPLGRPVVPDVYIRAATSSGVTPGSGMSPGSSSSEPTSSASVMSPASGAIRVRNDGKDGRALVNG